MVVPGHFALTGPYGLSHFVSIASVLVDNTFEIGNKSSHLFLALLHALLVKSSSVSSTDLSEYVRSQEKLHIGPVE